MSRARIGHPDATETVLDIRSYDIQPGALVLTERLSGYGPETRTTIIPWHRITAVQIEQR